jgi:23S rRNA pseudouridine2604 synthase
MNENSESINKFISSKGLCSRREADKWIDQGRIMINGAIAKKGNRVSPGDLVAIDGKVLDEKPEAVYMLFNKPAGVTSTTDLKDKTNIIDYINFPQRIFPIGRLDKDSTGLIMLTNNGDIVNRILREENYHEKEYIVSVNAPIDEKFISRMSKPIPMLGKMTNPCVIRQIDRYTFNIILTQGFNRQIRRMCTYCGYEVLALKRVRIMHMSLGKLKEGEWRFLTEGELKELMDQIKD